MKMIKIGSINYCKSWSVINRFGMVINDLRD